MMTEMNEKEIRERSQKKVKQIRDLCDALNVRLEAKQRIGQDMFLEMVVIFNDLENYPVETRAPEKGEEAGTVIEENPESGPTPVAPIFPTEDEPISQP